MKWLVSAAQMKEIDRNSIEQVGIPSLVLMERAALSVTDRVFLFLEKNPQTAAVIAVGTGNNGADGLAAARQLLEKGIRPQIFCAGNPEKCSAEWKTQREILGKLGLEICCVTEDRVLPDFSGCLVVDAIFGIGISGNIEGSFRRLIDQINETAEYVISVDIPSGIHTDTGAVMGTAIRAQETVTFGYEKAGMSFYPGKEYAGRIRIAEIGFAKPSDISETASAYAYEERDICLPYRAPCGNKGTFGRVLVIAGSENMAGAACFAAKAALASGAGLVRVLTMESNRQILQTVVPEAVLTTWKTVPEQEEIRKITDWADVLIVGPGMGTGENSLELLKKVLTVRTCPGVFDADALTLFSRNPDLEKCLTEADILTPHMGELSRLLGVPIQELCTDKYRMTETASAFLPCIWVCKDAVTVTASAGHRPCVNQTGNEGMAAGGSGDVLTGIIGALLAGGMSSAEAAETGAYLHGLAGDAAKALYGSRSMGPLQIIEQLSTVFCRLEQDER